MSDGRIASGHWPGSASASVEATAFPAVMSLIPDLFHPQGRGRAMAVFQSNSFIGIVGTVLAGVLAAALEQKLDVEPA